MRSRVTAVLLGVGICAAVAQAADNYANQPDSIEVTATRIPEAIDNIPASITVVSGEQLRRVGANDLRTALESAWREFDAAFAGA